MIMKYILAVFMFYAAYNLVFSIWPENLAGECKAARRAQKKPASRKSGKQANRRVLAAKQYS